MVKVYTDKEAVSFRTYSRSFCAPHRFIVLREELAKLMQKRYTIAKDIHSFAEMSLRAMPDGREALSICFTWLKNEGDNEVTGCTENVLLPFEPFRSYLVGDSEERQEWKLLSLSERRMPRLEFYSRKNLREVAENPLIRHKLSVFFRHNLQWPGYTRIVVSDDWIPYSFAFTCYLNDKPGISGGIILHGQKNLQKASYGIHT